jgi:hypothetical protein
MFVSLSSVSFTSTLGMFDEMCNTFIGKFKKTIEQSFDITVEVQWLFQRFFY